MIKHSFILILFLTAAAVAVGAHPLGNFSVNQFTGIEPGRSAIRLRQILDLAEIPTFQSRAEIDVDADGTISPAEADSYAERITGKYLENLRLAVDGERVGLETVRVKGTAIPGEGGLQTLRVEWDLVARVNETDRGRRLSFENGNFEGRAGWNEIGVSAANGITVFDSDVFAGSISDGLRKLGNLGISSLAERRGSFAFTTGAIPDGAKPLRMRDGSTANSPGRDRLAELISVPEITPAIALLGLLVAFVLGAVHAMSPGHGKTVVGAYLVGSRGTLRHALFLALTVTITHTIGVFGLGLVTFFASALILPETIMPFLSFLSGLLVFYIGLTLLASRIKRFFSGQKHDHHHHGHEHDHEHLHGDAKHTHDGRTHSHLPPDEISWRNLVALGVSGGLLPCPSALVLMLSAVSLGRVGYGLILTLAFSFGLAMTLSGVGLMFLYLGKALGGNRFAENRFVRLLPAFSAFVVACLGALICWDSLRG